MSLSHPDYTGHTLPADVPAELIDPNHPTRSKQQADRLRFARWQVQTGRLSELVPDPDPHPAGKGPMHPAPTNLPSEAQIDQGRRHGR